MKIFEFMAMGVPVLAPDYVPILDVIRDNETGWLFPKGDRATCAKRAFELAHDIENYNVVGHTAQEYIRAERQWLNNCDQLLQLYHHIRAIDSQRPISGRTPHAL
jgi:glycosyltransferase involved in cell wall biosynthesis